MRALLAGMVTVFLASLQPFQVAVGPESRRVVRDGADREVSVPLNPRRIVSMAPSVTEILFALEAGDRVVGVTDFCDYPEEAATRARIGGVINPDLETIVGLAPDLEIASTSGNYRDDVERIQRMGIPVYTVDTPSVDRILTTMDRCGELLGVPETASRLTGALRDRIDRVRSASRDLRRPRTLFVIEPDPLIAPGGGTFLGEALAIAGADLVTADAAADWGQYDIEKVLEMRPEVILTTEANREWSRLVSTLPDWKKVPAVESGRVYVVSDSIQHPGPRLVSGIEEVARRLRAGVIGRE